MNSMKYYNVISREFFIFSKEIEVSGKLNLTNIHVFAEYFYLTLFNIVYDYSLENVNSRTANYEAIDLIDHKNKIYFQISAKCDKDKIESTLKKEILTKYPNYNLKFISLLTISEHFRNSKYVNANNIVFNPKTDIFDLTSILRDILALPINKMKNLYDLFVNEFGDNKRMNLDSNLTSLIFALYDGSPSESSETNITDFEIDKKINRNNLEEVSDNIKEYSRYFKSINSQYIEFDKQGKNVRPSILNLIRNFYKSICGGVTNEVEIYYSVLDRIKVHAKESRNFDTRMPEDQLEFCSEIIMVDAFIRCKIFKNPEELVYAPSR